MTYDQRPRHMIHWIVCTNNKTRLRLFQFLLVTMLTICVWYYYIMQHTKSHLLGGRISSSINSTCTFSRTARNTRKGAKKLSFIGGGAQKAGTTTLHQYLKSHPYLLLPNKRKEAHFFDQETTDWTRPDFREYEYRDSVQNELQITGEITPEYMYLPNAMERIKCYNPDIKLIFIFRQPVDRAWSNWKMIVRRLCETDSFSRAIRQGPVQRPCETHSFSWAIRQGRVRLAKKHPNHHYLRLFSYVERGFYGEQLKKILKLFPREQLLLLLNEDMAANPTRMMQQISQFLGVPEIKGEIQPIRVHVAPESQESYVLKEEDAAYLQNLYNDDLKLFAKLSGLNITSWFR